MLLWLNPAYAGSFFTEVQELPDSVPELSKLLVSLCGNIAFRCFRDSHTFIVSRYKSTYDKATPEWRVTSPNPLFFALFCPNRLTGRATLTLLGRSSFQILENAGRAVALPGVFLLRTQTKMSTPSQIAANRANAQLSTGPTSAEGKAASCENNFRYGFAGAFVILPSENQAEYEGLLESLQQEYQPNVPSEHLLVRKMAQHYWLSQRALLLQTLGRPNELPLFLRYQTTNDRGFHRCLNDLLKLRAEKRRTGIGFESQQHKQAAEDRKKEVHKWTIVHAQAKADNQILQNLQFKGSEDRVEAGIRRIIDAEKAA